MTGATLLAVLVMAAGIAMTACGEDEPETEVATADLCADIDALQDAIGSLQDISTDTPIEDLRETRDSVEAALSDVRDSAADVGEGRVADIEDAYADLDETIDNLSEDMSLLDAAEAILDDLTTIASATADLFTSLDC